MRKVGQDLGVMRKLRDDSVLGRLAPEQRETLDHWLFDEHLGYERTRERVRQEFGLRLSIASVGRYYRRRAWERETEELVAASAHAGAINALSVPADQLRTAALALVGKAVLRLAREQPERVDDLAALTRLLLDSEANDLRRGRLKLAEKCFDYEAGVAANAELPHLRSYLGSLLHDDTLTPEQKNERMQTVLFGWEVAGAGSRPPEASQPNPS